MPKVNIYYIFTLIQVIKFIEKQDQTNRRIKEFSKQNYDAAIQWITLEKSDASKRHLDIKKSTKEKEPQIMDFKKVNPIDELPIFNPNLKTLQVPLTLKTIPTPSADKLELKDATKKLRTKKVFSFIETVKRALEPPDLKK